ncbi:hypothetical protein TNCV_4223281 [Trichonephila clavipes]|nr:hypothetical protein TNCV_4223281 [Trichonephila clavipes]
MASFYQTPNACGKQESFRETQLMDTYFIYRLDTGKTHVASRYHGRIFSKAPIKSPNIHLVTSEPCEKQFLGVRIYDNRWPRKHGHL